MIGTWQKCNKIPVNEGRSTLPKGIWIPSLNYTHTHTSTSVCLSVCLSVCTLVKLSMRDVVTQWPLKKLLRIPAKFSSSFDSASQNNFFSCYFVCLAGLASCYEQQVSKQARRRERERELSSLAGVPHIFFRREEENCPFFSSSFLGARKRILGEDRPGTSH